MPPQPNKLAESPLFTHISSNWTTLPLFRLLGLYLRLCIRGVPVSAFAAVFVFQLLRRYTVTSSASLSYVATFLSFPFTLDVLHSKSSSWLSSSWLSSSQRRDRYIARIEPIVSFEQNTISTKRTRFRLVAFPSPYEKSYSFGALWRTAEPGDAERERQRQRRKETRVHPFRTGYRFRHGGTTLGNDERPCVPLEDKSSRIPAVFVGRYLFRQRIIVVYYLKFGTFNSPLVSSGSGSNTGETILEWKNPSATSAEKFVLARDKIDFDRCYIFLGKWRQIEASQIFEASQINLLNARLLERRRMRGEGGGVILVAKYIYIILL